jgi:hypothetical protein
MPNKELVSGARTGNAKYLLKAQAEGYTIRWVWGQDKALKYEPRGKFDPQPFTDGFFRYGSRECWAEPPCTQDK